jgi:hypothetical protein
LFCAGRGDEELSLHSQFHNLFKKNVAGVLFWDSPFGIYLAVLAFFHFSEFLTTGPEIIISLHCACATLGSTENRTFLFCTGMMYKY